jgi:hypothetical protein
MAHRALGRCAMKGAQQTLRYVRRARCSAPLFPQPVDGFEPSTSSRPLPWVQCSAVGKSQQAWRLTPGTAGPPKGFSSLAGTDLKPPTQPLPDPEVMKHVEAELGSLDTKPLVRGRRQGRWWCPGVAAGWCSESAAAFDDQLAASGVQPLPLMLLSGLAAASADLQSGTGIPSSAGLRAYRGLRFGACPARPAA